MKFIGREFRVEGHVGTHGVLKGFTHDGIANVPRVAIDLFFYRPDVAAQRCLHYRFAPVYRGRTAAEGGVGPVSPSQNDVIKHARIVKRDRGQRLLAR